MVNSGAGALEVDETYAMTTILSVFWNLMRLAAVTSVTAGRDYLVRRLVLHDNRTRNVTLGHVFDNPISLARTVVFCCCALLEYFKSTTR